MTPHGSIYGHNYSFAAELHCRARHLVGQLVNDRDRELLAPLFFKELVEVVNLREDLYCLLEPLLAALIEYQGENSHG